MDESNVEVDVSTDTNKVEKKDSISFSEQLSYGHTESERRVKKLLYRY